MSSSTESHSHQERTSAAIEVTIRLGLVLLLLMWGFQIVSPFLHPISWGAILAIALLPVFDKAVAALGGKRGLVGTGFILISIVLVIVPTSMLVSGSIDSVSELAKEWKAGEIRIPVPPERVQDWPLIGDKLYKLWYGLATDLEKTLSGFTPQLVSLGQSLLGFITGSGLVLLLAAFSLVIAGVLMIHAESCSRFAHLLSRRLVGEEGTEFVTLATSTVRSVANGVVGTALIQAAGAALGLVLMGIPFAAVWALLVLIVAVVQLPPWLILAPVAIWAFSAYDTVPAVIFAIWSLIVSVADAFLKPMLLGRGVDIPMLVILIGALGGMVVSGIMGLFVGAVILALIYRLFIAWLQGDAGTESA